MLRTLNIDNDTDSMNAPLNITNETVSQAAHQFHFIHWRDCDELLNSLSFILQILFGFLNKEQRTTKTTTDRNTKKHENSEYSVKSEYTPWSCQIYSKTLTRTLHKLKLDENIYTVCINTNE